jgi:DNA-binding NarL/FixJ family response regulator
MALTCSSLANSHLAGRAASRNPQLNLRVPQRIRELSASGMTRAAIAKELGVSTGAVSKYKKPAAD